MRLQLFLCLFGEDQLARLGTLKPVALAVVLYFYGLAKAEQCAGRHHPIPVRSKHRLFSVPVRFRGGAAVG